jgi:hypothetical protein
MSVNEGERTKWGQKGGLTLDTCFAKGGFRVVLSETDVGLDLILL